jgi:hypothetical protein
MLDSILYIYCRRYVSTEKYIGILHESDEQAKKMKRQAISIKKYAAAHMIRYSDRRNYSIYRYCKQY